MVVPYLAGDKPKPKNVEFVILTFQYSSRINGVVGYYVVDVTSYDSSYNSTSIYDGVHEIRDDSTRDEPNAGSDDNAATRSTCIRKPSKMYGDENYANLS